MAKKKKKVKFKDSPLLKTAIYAVKGTQKRVDKNAATKANAAQTKESQAAIDKGKKMAKVEAYAKEHGITVTQAMIHFMD